MDLCRSILVSFGVHNRRDTGSRFQDVTHFAFELNLLLVAVRDVPLGQASLASEMNESA